MKNKYLVRAGLIAVIAIVLGGGTFFLYQNYASEKNEIRQTFLAEEKVRFDVKTKQIELAVQQIYQGTRTVSLLPSIRSLTGGNLPKDFPGKFDKDRFGKDAQMTVQQVYNNLASNVSVSEIYAVLKGFRPDEGETPFFMYDSLIIQDGGAEEETVDAGETANPDQPEDLEDEEYAYYLKQLDLLASSHPTFTKEFGETINTIPFIASPAMRTCDNTQYLSKVEGNVRDSFGILFSVPFYSNRPDKEFLGIISTIVRTNIFEAMLLDRPFVVITEEDQAQARKEGWTMPASPVRFVLRNSQHDVTIFDRRNESLQASIKSVLDRGESDLVLERTLDTPAMSEWHLEYLTDIPVLQSRIADAKQIFILKLTGFLLLALSFGLLIALQQRRRSQARKIKSVIGQLRESSYRVMSASNQVSDSSQGLAEGASDNAASLEETSSTLEEITSTTRLNAENARNGELSANEAMESSQKGREAMSRMLDSINDIKSSSDDTARIIKTIDEIAFQTNLLALNAAVEAARAGESGKGFAVVAEEVRNLASRSAQAAKETGDLIQSSLDKSESGVMVAQEVGAALQEVSECIERVVKLNREVAAASDEQALGIGQINQAVSKMETITQSNAANAEQTASSSEDLSLQAEVLEGMVVELGRIVGSNQSNAQMIENSPDRNLIEST